MIMSLLAVLILVGFRTDGKQFALDGAVQNFVAEVRIAQSLASSAAPFEEPPFNGNVPSAYGMYVDEVTDTILLFADKDTGTGADGLYNSSDDGLVHIVPLDSALMVSDISIELESGGTTSPSEASIAYTPPHAQGQIGGSTNNRSLSVTIQLIGDPGRTRVVKFNKVGFIDVQ